MLELPERRQGTEYSCGPAEVGSVFGYYGVDVRESELKEALDTNPETGTQEDAIVNLAKKLGFESFMKRMTVKEVIDYINKEIPVILLIQAWADKPVDYKTTREFPHFITAIGYSNNGMYFKDPSLLVNGFLRFDELEDRWRGSKNDHLGIVIYGGHPDYSESKAEPIQ
jgi:predicted double-glycine peptidase